MARRLSHFTAVALGFALGLAPVAHAQTRGITVELRASQAPDAPVVEEVRLYAASYALVIGIDDYTGGWPKLRNAVKDAELVAEELARRGFEVTLRTNLTSEVLRREFREFFAIKGADPEARLLLWYSGHGHTLNGEGFLVPADAPLPTSPQFIVSALHMRTLGSMVRLARAKHVFSIFDSCFAGTVFENRAGPVSPAITRATTLPVRAFLTSGDADQQVSDDGTFRTLFLRAIRGEEPADVNSDGYVTGSELGMFLADRVTNLTRGAQTPRSGKILDVNYDRGDFVFALPEVEEEAPVAVATPGTTADPVELAFWDSIKSSDDPEDYRAYLKAYPEGNFAELARVRIAATAGKAEAAARAEAAAAELAFWDAIKDSDDPKDYRAYLEAYPEGQFAALARVRAGAAAEAAKAASADAAELALWDSIKDSTSAEDYQAYLETYPEGRFAALARVRMEAAAMQEEEQAKAAAEAAELALWDQIKDRGGPEDYRAYLRAYPEGRFAALARVRAEVETEAAEAPAEQVAALAPAPSEPSTQAEAPVQPAIALSAFNGVWEGRMTRSTVPLGCPPRAFVRFEIEDGRVTGEASGTFGTLVGNKGPFAGPVKAAVDQNGRIEGWFNAVTFSGVLDAGTGQGKGTWTTDFGCEGTFALQRQSPAPASVSASPPAAEAPEVGALPSPPQPSSAAVPAAAIPTPFEGGWEGWTQASCDWGVLRLSIHVKGREVRGGVGSRTRAIVASDAAFRGSVTNAGKIEATGRKLALKGTLSARTGKGTGKVTIEGCRARFQVTKSY